MVGGCLYWRGGGGACFACIYKVERSGVQHLLNLVVQRHQRVKACLRLFGRVRGVKGGGQRAELFRSALVNELSRAATPPGPGSFDSRCGIAGVRAR